MPKERLVVMLRYLASGDSQQSHSFNFRIGRSTISRIIHEICEAIWLALLKVYLKAPGSANEWLNVANEFDKNWNFPNCLGAIDGKHVTIECPRNAGSAFYNYKNVHILTLLAVSDANYRFTLVDIGGYGRDNDTTLLEESQFGKAFENNELRLPETKASRREHATILFNRRPNLSTKTMVNESIRKT